MCPDRKPYQVYLEVGTTCVCRTMNNYCNPLAYMHIYLALKNCMTFSQSYRSVVFNLYEGVNRIKNTGNIIIIILTLETVYHCVNVWIQASNVLQYAICGSTHLKISTKFFLLLGRFRQAELHSSDKI